MKDLFGCSAALSLALNLEEREAVAAARLDGARRLYEALKAQGGREEPEEPALERPARTLEETAAQLRRRRPCPGNWSGARGSIRPSPPPWRG